MTGPTTLGFWDYVLMFFVSLVVAPVALAVVFAVGAREPAYVLVAPVIGVYQLIFAVPVALVGLPLLCLISRAVPSELGQVAVAAVLPGVLLFGYAGLVHLNGAAFFWLPALAGGVGSAVGRAVVGRLARRPPRSSLGLSGPTGR